MNDSGSNNTGRAVDARIFNRAAVAGALILLGAAVLWFLIWHGIIEARVSRGVARVAAEASRYGDIDYQMVRVGYLRPTIRIHDIRIRTVFAGPELFISTLDIHRRGRRQGRGEALRATASGVEVSLPDALTALPELSAALGGGRIQGDITVDCRYDPEARTVTVRRFEISSPRLGTMSAAISAANLDLQNLALYVVMPHAIMFNGCTAVYTDNVPVAEWKQDKADLFSREHSYRARLLLHLTNALISAERDGEKDRAENFRQLLSFLDDPQRLAITAVPHKAVPLGQILGAVDAAELMDLLNIRIRANNEAYARRR